MWDLMKDAVSGPGHHCCHAHTLCCLACCKPCCPESVPVCLCEQGDAQQFADANPRPLPTTLQGREAIFAKGQSKRIWGELYKVLDSSDVVIQVRPKRRLRPLVHCPPACLLACLHAATPLRSCWCVP